MIVYTFSKNYAESRHLVARQELISLRTDLHLIQGFGEVWLHPSRSSRIDSYFISSDNDKLNGTLDITYLVKDVFRLQIRIPKIIDISIRAQYDTKSLDEFAKKFSFKKFNY